MVKLATGLCGEPSVVSGNRYSDSDPRQWWRVSILVGAEGALVVIGVLRECAHLHRVSTPDLGQRVAELGSFLADRILPWRVVKDGSLREIREAESFRRCCRRGC